MVYEKSVTLEDPFIQNSDSDADTSAICNCIGYCLPP